MTLVLYQSRLNLKMSKIVIQGQTKLLHLMILILLHLRYLPSSLEGPATPKKRGNLVGARMLALTKFDEGGPTPDFVAITSKTSVSKSSVYKIRAKAISRGWHLGNIVEPVHVDNTPHSGRPKTSTATALFIIETITKSSTTRG